MVNKVTENILWTAGLLTLGVAAVATKKGAGPLWNKVISPIGKSIPGGIKWGASGLWNGTKKTTTFVLKEGQIAGPTSAGILGGTAAALSYKYSPWVAREAQPWIAQKTQSGDQNILLLTRAGVTALSTFVTTALFIRYATGKLSSHQVKLLGTLGYATTAALISTYTLPLINPNFRDPFQHAYQLVEDFYEKVTAEASSPLRDQDIQFFWDKNTRYTGEEREDYTETFDNIGGYPPAKQAQLLVGLENEALIPTFLNELNADHYYCPPEECANIFLALDPEVQVRQYDALNEDIKEGIEGIKENHQVARNRYANTSRISWNAAAKAGILSGVATGVVAAVAYLGVKTFVSFINTFPAVKGTVPAALVLSSSYFGARHAIDLTKDYHGMNNSEMSEFKIRMAKRLTSIGTAVIAGILFIPTVSSFILKKRVGYLSATRLSLIAGIGATALVIFNQHGEVENFFCRRG